jgi:hypothetical protein
MARFRASNTTWYLGGPLCEVVMGQMI